VIHKLSMGTKVITLLLVHIRRMVVNFHAVERAALVSQVRRLGLVARNCGAIAIQVFVGSPRGHSDVSGKHSLHLLEGSSPHNRAPMAPQSEPSP
jgi:hypothetical protein